VTEIHRLFHVEQSATVTVLRLISSDGTNRLTRERVLALMSVIQQLPARPLIITGNDRFFSAGADLSEISALTGPAAYEFSKMGQALMDAIDNFPALACAAVSGYCMGGGLDLALACDLRIAHRHAVFGHRGAALGLITGWGGMQRLPRLIGKGRALEMFIAAEKVNAARALEIGLVDEISADPVGAAIESLARRQAASAFST
jgi:enoyl-CoA hydratase